MPFDFGRHIMFAGEDLVIQKRRHAFAGSFADDGCGILRTHCASSLCKWWHSDFLGSSGCRVCFGCQQFVELHSMVSARSRVNEEVQKNTFTYAVHDTRVYKTG